MYTRETELRHLQPNDAYKLGMILDDDNDSWKKLMEIIPKELNAQHCSADGTLDWEQIIAVAGLKYNNDHIRLIETATKRPGESRFHSQILFEEWGTSGRRHERPTVGVLLQLLVQAELFRAADFVATTFLNEPPPMRPLNGPAARIDISLSDDIFKDIEELVNDSTFFPGTMSLNENANYTNSLLENNKDYFTKYQQLDKHVLAYNNTNTNTNASTNTNTNNENENENTSKMNAPKPPPRMSRSTRQQQQPQQQETQNHELHTTGQQSTETTTSLNNAPDMPHLSMLMSRDVSTHLESNNISEAPIPLISLLAATSSTPASTIESATAASSFNNSIDSFTMSSESAILPAISALNLNGEHIAERTLTANALLVLSAKLSESSGNSESQSRTSSLSEVSENVAVLAVRTDNVDAISDCDGNDVDDENYVDDDEDDDDDNSVPNLSIFEQHSSNNDSSLTTVTGTSGENSFDLNDCSSTSNDDNIPCLSVLKQ